MPDEQKAVLRRGREGGRWINERPTSEDFASWFTESMRIDSGLQIQDYIGGVVLIPALDTKAKVVLGFSDTGKPLIDQREELSYIPYAKVETRINYFWDLLDVHEDWVGVVEHVASPRMPIDFVHTTESRDATAGSWTQRELRAPGALTSMVHQLPAGFSVMSIGVDQGYTHFLCCTIRASIYNRAEWDAASPSDRAKLAPRRTGRGTKQVPLLKGYNNKVWADDSSLMKAETGALGRALGFAGIFIIPGSGVATAEDMLESLSQAPPPAEAGPDNAGPAAPAEAPVRSPVEQAEEDEAEMRKKAIALFQALGTEHPEQANAFTVWARSRQLRSLSDAKGPALRGVIKKLERLQEEGDAGPQEAAQEPTAPESAEEASDVPAEAPEEAGDAEPSGQAG